MGGDLDYALNRRWSLRVLQADYFRAGSGNNIRIGSGVAVRVGKT